MKRLLVVLLLLVTAATVVDPAFARRVVVRRVGHPRLVRHRTVVVVHRGWPLRRPLRQVIARPATVRIPTAAFLAPIVWAPVVVTAAPAPEILVWQDAATLSKDDGWTEFTLDCNARGSKLYLEIKDGKVQADWAEVVFENGDAQVVDFAEKTHGPGLYSLLDFRDGRLVDHVRMVARAKSEDSRVALEMEK